MVVFPSKKTGRIGPVSTQLNRRLSDKKEGKTMGIQKKEVEKEKEKGTEKKRSFCRKSCCKNSRLSKPKLIDVDVDVVERREISRARRQTIKHKEE
jgi:hypothetical protein